MKKKKIIVLTPVGPLHVKTIEDAKEMKELYGYQYIVKNERKA